MTPVAEFTPGLEAVTATVHMSQDPGMEAYQGALNIGYYTGSSEIFLECEGGRISIPAHLVKPIIAQIRRAAKIALEQNK